MRSDYESSDIVPLAILHVFADIFVARVGTGEFKMFDRIKKVFTSKSNRKEWGICVWIIICNFFRGVVHYVAVCKSHCICIFWPESFYQLSKSGKIHIVRGLNRHIDYRSVPYDWCELW